MGDTPQIRVSPNLENLALNFCNQKAKQVLWRSIYDKNLTNVDIILNNKFPANGKLTYVSQKNFMLITEVFSYDLNIA